MKTILFQIAKGIRAIAATLIILVALTGISKGEVSGKEFLQNDNELAFQVKSWLSNSTYWSAAENLQPEEITTAMADSNANSEYQGGNQELSLEMESLIQTGAYWDDETSTREGEVYDLIKTWISNEAFWSNEGDASEPDLGIRMKSWISSGAYWSEETVTNKQDLALQIRSWINNGSFWKDSNDQSEIRTELASN